MYYIWKIKTWLRRRSFAESICQFDLQHAFRILESSFIERILDCQCVLFSFTADESHIAVKPLNVHDPHRKNISHLFKEFLQFIACRPGRKASNIELSRIHLRLLIKSQ